MTTLTSTHVLLLTYGNGSSTSDCNSEGRKLHDLSEAVRAVLNPLGYHLSTLTFADYRVSGLENGGYQGILLECLPHTADVREVFSYLQTQAGTQPFDMEGRVLPVPVVVIVERGEEALAAEALRLGADSYLVKDSDCGYLSLLPTLLDASLQDRSRRARAANECVQAEVALTWESNVNAAMAELSQALISSASLEDITSLVLRKAKELTDTRFGFVGYMDSRLDAMVSASMTRDIWSSCNVPEKSIVFHDYVGLWGWVLKNRQPILTNAPLHDPRSTGVPEGHIPIKRFLSAPALLDDVLMGVIALANPERDYELRDLAVVKRLASLLALAVGAHRSREALQEYAQKQRALYAVSAATASLQPSATLLSTVLEEVMKLLQARAGWIAVIGNELSEERTDCAVHVISSAGLPRTWWGPVVDQGDSAIGVGSYSLERSVGDQPPEGYDPKRAAHLCPILAFAARRQAIESPQVVEQCVHFPRELTGLEAAHITCTPIIAGGELFGSFSLVWGLPENTTSADGMDAVPEASTFTAPPAASDHVWLNAIGQQIGIALQNARLYREARQLDRLRVLNELDMALHSSLETESLGRVTLEHATRALDAPRGTLLLCSSQQSLCFRATLEGEQSWHRPLYSEAAREQIKALIDLLQERKQAMPLRMEQLSELIGSPAVVLGPKVSTSDWLAPGDLIAPISGEEGVIGLLILAARATERSFVAEDLELVQAMASRAGQTLQNAQLYQLSQNQTRQLEMLNRISSFAAASLEPSTVLDHIVKLAAEAVNAEEGSILLTEGERGVAIFVATVDRDVPEGYRMIEGQGLVGWVIENDASVLVNDVLADPRFCPEVDGLTGFQTRSLLCAPLRHRANVTGVIEVMNKRDGGFGRDDLELLEAVAAIASVALRNAQLYTRTRARAEELALINEFSMTMTASLDFHQVVNEALRQIARLFPSYGVALLQRDAHTGQFSFTQALVAGAYCEIDLIVPPGVGLVDMVHAQQQPLLVDDAQSDPTYWQEANPHLPFLPRAMMVAPLLIQGQVLGIVFAASNRVGVYGQDDLNTFQGLSATLAVALQNAQLYGNLHTLLKERERTQSLMVHTEKMAALGRLVASLAHEINNPLQAVQGCLTLAIEESEEMVISSDDKETLTYYLHIAETEIDRISAIVRRMRDFYRPAREGMQPTDIHEVLKTILALTNKQLQHSSVTVEQHWIADLPFIPANPDNLKQVFLNLVLNAIDAMPDGGTLKISTALVEAGTQALASSSPAVMVEFEDTGMGIPPEAMSRMFELFFTTKEHGSGLGLSISYSIIKAHNGTISVSSQPGLGTTFTIVLPQTRQEEDGFQIEDDGAIE